MKNDQSNDILTYLNDSNVIIRSVVTVMWDEKIGSTDFKRTKTILNVQISNRNYDFKSKLLLYDTNIVFSVSSFFMHKALFFREKN